MRATAALRRWVARVRTGPARVERIDRTMPLVLDTVRHVDELAKWAEQESQASAATTTQVLETTTTLSSGLSAMRSELSAMRSEVAESRTELGRTSAELGRTSAEIHAHRSEGIVHQQELRSSFGRLHHDARVGFETAVGPQRDEALHRLAATVETPHERRDGLSVIMITWNHAGFLPEAIASARRALEALDPSERGQILILDDGSTDETRSFLEQFADDDLMHIISAPRNLGLGRARNILLAACPTVHGVILDADNRLLPDGVRAIYATARRYRSTITYGQVVASTAEGTDWAAIAYVPSRESLRTCQSFDSMSIIDVAAVQALGGYSDDPALAGVADDFDLILRCLRRGDVVGSVPAVLGWYRFTPLRHSAQLPDMRSVNSRIARSYLYDDPDFDHFALFCAHPATGLLWASPAAEERIGRPPEAAAITSPALPAAPRVLLIVSGGVGNLGDDAISDAVHKRVRRAHPTARIDLISDRDLPTLTAGVAPWSGSLMELWQGLTDEELAGAADSAAGRVTIEALTPPVRNEPLLDLASFDVAYIAGGGFLSSMFAAPLLVPRVAVALTLAAAGVPVVWSGQGIGPCSDDELLLVEAAVRTARAFGCRDLGSIEMLSEEVRGGAAMVGDDALGASRASGDIVGAALAAAHVATERFIVFHVRRAEYVGDVRHLALADAVDELASLTGATVVGLAINDNPPAEAAVFIGLSRHVARRSPWRLVHVPRSPALAAGILAAADAVVSHSYHLALWALESGTPAVLVAGSRYYERKASGLGRLAGLTGSIAVTHDVDAAALRAQLERVRSELSDRVLADAAAQVQQWWDDQLGVMPVHAH